jgi:PAS domain S-box-containing protein
MKTDSKNKIQAEAADQDLEGVRHLNKLILESAGEGVYGLDAEGKTTFVNPAAEKMTGYTAQEMIGHCQHKLTHHTKPDGTSYIDTECPIYAAVKDGKVHTVSDEVFWRKDGTSFPVEYVSTPIWENLKLRGAVRRRKSSSCGANSNWKMPISMKKSWKPKRMEKLSAAVRHWKASCGKSIWWGRPTPVC